MSNIKISITRTGIVFLYWIIVVFLRIFDARIYIYTSTIVLALISVLLFFKSTVNAVRLRPKLEVILYVMSFIYTLIAFCFGKVSSYYLGQIFFVFFSWVFILTMKYSCDPSQFDRIYEKYYKFSIILGYIGICEYFIGHSIIKKWSYANYFSYLENTTNYRISTFFVHPIVYANIMLIAIFWCLFKDESSNRYIHFMLFLINIILTGSRSEWLALIISLVFYYFFVRQIKNRDVTKRKILMFFLAICSLIVIFSYQGLLKRVISTRMNNIYGGSGYIVRKNTIIATWDRFKANGILNILFGSGNGSIIRFLSSVLIKGKANNYVKVLTTDNTYLSVLYDYGIVFFALFACYVIYIIWYGIKKRENLIYSCIILALSIAAFFYEIFSWETLVILLNITIVSNCDKRYVYYKVNDVIDIHENGLGDNCYSA